MLAPFFAVLASTPPATPPDYPRPPSATAPTYLEILESNTHLLYPALGVLALVMIALGIIQALQRDEVTPETKLEWKRLVIAELRRRLAGRTLPELSEATGVPPRRLAALLEDLQKDAIVEPKAEAGRTVWRMRGLSS